MSQLAIGAPTGLLFELTWLGDPRGSAADVTLGELRIIVAGCAVWGGGESNRGLTWTWVELLEFLAERWFWLRHEQSLPVGLRGDAASVRSKARARWDALPPNQQAAEELEVFLWTETHNLAAALQGAWPSDLWLLSRGLLCEVAAAGNTWLLRSSEVFSTLESLGMAIEERLQLCQDRRADAARTRWQARATTIPSDAIRVVTGLPSSYLDSFGDPGDQAKLLAWDPALQTESPQLAVARMSGAAIPPADLRQIAKAIEAQPARATPELDELAADLERELSPMSVFAPHQSGYEAAVAVRKWAGLKLGERAEPEQLLKAHGVAIATIEVNEAVDAVATWGAGHGPTVFVNSRGHHCRLYRGRRATLAHELAHLVLDRNGALPLAEVIGGNAAPGIEARANAFAAELLVPREAVLDAHIALQDVPALHRSLQRRFDASAEVVAWQIRNAGLSLDSQARLYLRRFVSRPDRF